MKIKSVFQKLPFFLTAFFPAKPMVKFETDSIEIHFYQKYHKMSPFLCDQKIEVQMNKEKKTYDTTFSHIRLYRPICPTFITRP